MELLNMTNRDQIHFIQTVSIEILVYYSRQSFKFVALSEIMENKGNNLKFSSPKVGLLGIKKAVT